MKKSSIFACIVLISVSMFLVGFDSIEENSRENSFRIEGNTIYDPYGEEFVGIGANVSGPEAAWPRETIGEEFVSSVQDWGFNILRANWYVFRDEVHSGPWPVWDLEFSIEEMVDIYTEKEIVIMIEVHDFTGGLFNDAVNEELDYGFEDLINFWENMANKFGDNPYVWFNIMNEPGEGDSADYYDEWVKVHNDVVDTIRAQGADNIIVVNGMYWGQDAGANWSSSRDRVKEEESAILSRGQEILENDPINNILFSFHTYDQWSSSDNDTEMIENFIEDAYAKDLALFVGEWGWGPNRSEHQKELSPKVLKTILPYGVGSTVWHAQHGDGFDICYGEDDTTELSITGIDDLENPTNLTEWLGQPLWDALKGEL